MSQITNRCRSIESTPSTERKDPLRYRHEKHSTIQETQTSVVFRREDSFMAQLSATGLEKRNNTREAGISPNALQTLVR